MTLLTLLVDSPKVTHMLSRHIALALSLFGGAVATLQIILGCYSMPAGSPPTSGLHLLLGYTQQGLQRRMTWR